MTPSNTVLDELWNDFATTPEVEIRNRLGAFLFSGDDVKKSVSMLSGGEKARLLLAKLSMENNNFLILDEPTNHLDLDAVIWLERWLVQYQGTLVLISHDRDFLDPIVTKILHIENQKLNEYTGDYSSFEVQRATKLAQQTAMYRQQQQKNLSFTKIYRPL